MAGPEVIDTTSGEPRLREPMWFCVRTRTKSEHIAAAHLTQLGIEDVFCPRIRYQKRTVRGKVWFSEALFPSYLFAKFAFAESHRKVRHATAATGIVSFGEKVPAIDESLIFYLREEFGSTELLIEEREPGEGESVTVNDGPLRGIAGLITKVLPARRRVEVLLDFLGQQRVIELSQESVARLNPPEIIGETGAARPGFVRKSTRGTR